MNKKNNIVAFIDILGFKNIVNAHFSGIDKNALNNIKDALKTAEKFAISMSKGTLQSLDVRFSFKQFSDCVCISMPMNERDRLTYYAAFINIVRLYQYILLDKNILVRGAISVGRHFQNNNTIFSEGLIKSYELETKHAIYPRIILDKDMVSNLTNLLLEQTLEEKLNILNIYGQSLIVDWDDEVFVSPFGLVEQQMRTIEALGLESYRQVINSVLKNNKIIDKLPDNFNPNDFNGTSMNEFLSRVDFILASNLPHDVRLKHKWLKQLIQWVIEPDNSQIKFQYYIRLLLHKHAHPVGEQIQLSK